jgi:hypothetical protein
MGGTILGCFAESTLSEMKKILRLRLRMTANGLSMTGSKPFKFGIGVKIYSVVVFEKGGANR